MVRLAKVVRSSDPKKKFTAIFDDGTRVHFGGRGYGDYILHTKRSGRDFAKAKRAAYIARHSKGGENWKNAKSPGALSRWILWEYPTLEKAVRLYNSHFR